jgi:integrase
MQDLVKEYLTERRSLGFALENYGRQLLSFARFADSIRHRGPLTIDLAVRWATAPSQHQRQFPGRRLEVIRPFARYRASVDGESEVPPRFLLGPPRRRPLHHIYTDDQVRALLLAAWRLGPRGALRPRTYGTLFGLLASTGLRVSEALHLHQSDVDLAAGILLIRETKFRKSRLVPIHGTVIGALGEYIERRNRRVPHPNAPTFFVADRGGALPYSTVCSVFQGLRSMLGWAKLLPCPRIHDLRHSFACRRLRDWYTQGIDVAAHIASLATYLGHAHVTDTYWYLTGTPELLALAADRFENIANLSDQGRDRP